jgi:hypothetical protein
MNAKQAILQAMLVDAICQTVIETGEAPEGPMYAAFMSKGCTLEQFNSLVAAAVATGKIAKHGNILSAVRP